MKHSHRVVNLLLSALTLISACNFDDDLDGQNINNYLLSYEEAISLTGQELQLIAVFTGYGQYQDLIEYGITLYRITYRTEFRGEAVVASGVIAVPQGVEEFPLLLGAHGTITDNQKAPSNLDFSQNSASGFELFAAFGFVSVIPDYLGFGASSNLVHPYFDYEGSAQPSVDMLKAAREFLTEQEVAFSDNLFLTGYSQGGYVATATLKYLEENPNELPDAQIMATAAGAGGYNIRQGMDIIFQEETYPVPANLAYIVYAYHQTNEIERPLSTFFRQPYASLIPNFFNGSSTTGTINSQLPSTLTELFQPDFINNLRDKTESEFLTAFEENSVHDWTPQSPLRLYHDVKDEVVPEQVSERTFEVMQQNGATDVQYFPFDLAASHQEAAQPMYLQAIPWFISLRDL